MAELKFLDQTGLARVWERVEFLIGNETGSLTNADIDEITQTVTISAIDGLQEMSPSDVNNATGGN
jgi:hypothetical protein